MSTSDLEAELRSLLVGVELVCSAEIPDELVTLAEEQIKPHASSPQIEVLGRRAPATLVTYFVVRGSALYSRNSVWQQLGVTEHSNRAGEAFLGALGRLGLPAFQQEVAAVNARRFVAPLLIHGAFPAAVASRLADRLQQEMRRGLVDGAEARRRLLADRDIELIIRRPAKRLLEWVPGYASELLDAVIEHIERPTDASAARLPRHIAEALDRVAESTRGLARMRPPVVRFELWQDYGPEVVALQDGWYVDVGTRTEHLRADEAVAVVPTVGVTASRAGWQSPIWTPQPAWFFTTSGQLVPAGDPLPVDCVAVLPRRHHFVDQRGDTVPETEDGYPLALDWSGHRSCRLDLSGAESIRLSDGAGTSWSVAPRRDIALLGDIVADALDRDGGNVYSAMPRLAIPGSRGRAVSISFHPRVGSARSATVICESHETVSAEAVLPPHACVGTLVARIGDGSRISEPICVVPGLSVAVPTEPMGPTSTGIVKVSAAEHVLEAESISIPPNVAYVDIPVRHVATGTVRAIVPRVSWGIRGTELARLELASGHIDTTVATLTSSSRWLVVRCTSPAKIGAVLEVGGRTVQTVEPRRTRSSAADSHHVSLPLESFADTLRAHDGEPIVIGVVVNGIALTAIRIGWVDGSERAYDPDRTRRPAAPSKGSPWDRVSWIGSRGDASPLADKTIEQLELRLRLAGPADSLVTYLRWIGQRLGEWGLTGDGAARRDSDLRVFRALGDAMWRLDAARYRLFAGHELGARYRERAHTHREALRRRSVEERNAREQWLLGRVPRFESLDQWAPAAWIHAALPHAQPGVQWLPAVTLYHCLALLTGDNDSGPAIADLAELEPELLLETIAFILQALMNGVMLRPPSFLEPVEPVEATEGFVATQTTAVPRAAPAEDCLFEVVDGEILIAPPPGTSVPAVRLCTERQAAFLGLAKPTGGGLLTVRLPDDLAGVLTVTVATGAALPLTPTGGVPIEVPTRSATIPTRPGRASSFESLEDTRLDTIVNQIMVRLDRSMLCATLVEELFDDELAAGRTLVRRALDGGCEPLDPLALACLPTSLLFSSLVSPTVELAAVLSRSRLLYACLAPRTPDAWRRLGWPAGVRFQPTTSTVDAFVGFVRDQSRPLQAMSARYTNASSLAHYDVVGKVTARLDSSQVGTTTVDVIMATHRMLTVESVEPEAMRMLLGALKSSPDGASRAVIAGVALALITNH